MKHGLVLLSDQDLDAPVLPAVATVSKDDSRDDGAFSIGEGDAQTQDALWVDRPYFTGNPSVTWMADKALRVIRAGGYCQVGNELNHPIEGWSGGVNAYRDLFDGTRVSVAGHGGSPARLLWMPPSPGFDGWQRWVLPGAPGYAVHCYGPRQVMQATVQWYLDNTAGELFVTECNPGAGNVFDLAAWSRDHLRPFLDWCSAQPRVRMVAYFAWRWNESARLPSSVDAVGTEVERLLRAWTPPKEQPVSDIVLTVPNKAAHAAEGNYDAGPRPRTIGVVIHTTRGGAKPASEYPATVNWFQNPEAGVSAHLVVGLPPFDEVARCVHDDEIAYHARECNQTHLGIEICQPNPGDPITDFQYRAAAEACRLWAKKYGFPLRRVKMQTEAGLIGHEDSAAGKRDGKTDPGPAFDWTKFIALTGGTVAPTPTPAPTDISKERDLLWTTADRIALAGYPWLSQGIKALVALSKAEK